MQPLRNTLGVIAGLAVGYALPALFLVSQTDFGIAMAIAAFCWMVIELTYVVERHREWWEDQEKQR